MQLFSISLPFDDGSNSRAQVHVIPHKIYNSLRGSELIEIYGIHERSSSRKHHFLTSSEDIIRDDKETLLREHPTNEIAICLSIYFPYEIQHLLTIYNKSYDYLKIYHILEDILGKQLICRYRARPIKSMINLSIEIMALPVNDGLIIFGKDDMAYFIECE